MNAALQNFLGRIDETKGEFVHVGITISTRVAVRHGLYQVPSLPLTGFAHAHLANNSTRLVSLLGRQLYNRGGYQYMNKLNAKGRRLKSRRFSLSNVTTPLRLRQHVIDHTQARAATDGDSVD